MSGQEVKSNELKMDIEAQGDFDLISSVKANGIHQVTKYRSRSTGMELVHAAVPGPVINGYIVLGKSELFRFYEILETKCNAV